MPETEESRIVLRVPSLGTRWVVDYKHLAIYAAGQRNFTMRVPYVYDDISETNAYAFDGFLLVFKQQARIQAVGSESNQLTSYEMDGCLQTKHIPFLLTYMRSLTSSEERSNIGAPELRIVG